MESTKIESKSSEIEPISEKNYQDARAEFADLYANSLPGFFSLSNHNVNMTDPLAQEFVGWRGECNSSIRPYHQILSRGTPNLANEYWVTSANVIRGTMTPQEAAEHMQKGLASWYAPQQ